MAEPRSADGGGSTTGHKDSAVARDTCDASNVLPREAAPYGITDGACLTTGITAPASPLLQGGTAAPLGGGGISNHHEVNGAVGSDTAPVTKDGSSASSTVSEADTAALSTPVESMATPNDDDDPWLDLISQHFFEVETVPSSEDDDDLGMVLIPEGFVEAGRVIAAGVEVGEDEDWGSALSLLSDETASSAHPVRTTAALEPATSPESQSAAGEGARANGAAVGRSTLSATARPFRPSTDTTEAAPAAIDSWKESMVTVLADGKTRAEATAATLPAAQEEESHTRANGAVVGRSTLSAAAKPLTPSTYTPEAASAAIVSWEKRTTEFLAKEKVRAEAAALAAEEEPDLGTPDQRREARHLEAAAMAVTAAPMRPRGTNQWSEEDALIEGVSLLRMDGTPSPSRVTRFDASQEYLANTLAAAQNVGRVDSVDNGLHAAMITLKLDDTIDSEGSRRGREEVHTNAQAQLAEALEFLDPVPANIVPTTTKVDNACAGWIGLLTLEEPATPEEEDARFVECVTVQTSVRDAISAMTIDKKPNVDEEEYKKAAPAREQKMLALEIQHREAVWRIRAEAQAARQALERCEEEEAEAAAKREKKREELEAQQRQAIADAEAERQAQQAAREREAAIRATLADVKRRRAAFIRRECLARVSEARADRRSLAFPCSAHLRSLWRQGKLG